MPAALVQSRALLRVCRQPPFPGVCVRRDLGLMCLAVLSALQCFLHVLKLF